MSGPIKILFNEVQITGGTACSGADGATSAGGTSTFTAASGAFITNGVQAGDKLVITGGADAGTYTVASVDSETQLTIAETWPTGSLTSQTWAIGTPDFLGLTPQAAAADSVIGPEHGSIIYRGAASAGLFTFQLGSQYGPDPLDWIRVERVILYLDETNITDVSLVVIPPEGSAYEAPFVRDKTEWDNAGLERILFLNGAGLRLRPRSMLRLITAGASDPQIAEVWWERERQIRPDRTTGSDVFAYHG